MNEEISNEARQLATNLTNDIKNASTRIEHIRLTQLALEAERLAEKIESLLDSHHADQDPPAP
jgi:hypothetical protein